MLTLLRRKVLSWPPEKLRRRVIYQPRLPHLIDTPIGHRS
jgi:hypothetical protein